ncbi:hypothetical protein EDB85DRAFT_1885902 [Lactarius pseudohatsudake]|nr:hypothetical protein EDB85DRAFT_1885902 [Lactarius pseudohatsudake]
MSRVATAPTIATSSIPVLLVYKLLCTCCTCSQDTANIADLHTKKKRSAWYIARHRRCHHLRCCPTQILTVPLVTTAEWSSRRSHSRVHTNPKRQHCGNWEDDNYDNGDDDTAMTTTTIVRKTDNGYSKTDRAYCNDSICTITSYELSRKLRLA